MPEQQQHKPTLLPPPPSPQHKNWKEVAQKLQEHLAHLNRELSLVVGDTSEEQKMLATLARYINGDINLCIACQRNAPGTNLAVYRSAKWSLEQAAKDLGLFDVKPGPGLISDKTPGLIVPGQPSPR